MKAKQLENDKLSIIIIDVLLKDGFIVDDKNVIVCDDKISMIDVTFDCSRLKKLGYKVVVYNKDVPNKKYLEKTENIRIIDVEELKTISLKYVNYQLINLLSK